MLELLEKRVKSRFSHRQIHLCPKFSVDDYIAIFQMYLRLPDDIDTDDNFVTQWNSRVEVRIMSALCHTLRHSLVMTQC